MSKSIALAELAAIAGKTPEIQAQPEMKPAPKLQSTDDRWKALKAVSDALNKQFNTSNSIVRLGSKVNVAMPSLASGLYTLDYDVIGIGGLPKGRIIEFFGPESSGKTTLALHFVGEEQRRGNLCAYVDAEHALDPTYMHKLGVDVDNLAVSQPDSGEQALETTEALVDSGAVSLIVVDSVAALVPQAELDGEMGDSHMGLQARLMSQAMRKLRGRCAINGVTVIFINQIRERLGVMFGNPETTTGGRALKFYASLRLDIKKVGGDEGKIVSGGVSIGHKMRLTAVKNKVGTPARKTEVDLIYGVGLDKEADLVDYASNIGAIDKSGSWFSFKGERLGQGRLNTIQVLKGDTKLMSAVGEEVKKAIAAQAGAVNGLQRERDAKGTEAQARA